MRLPLIKYMVGRQGCGSGWFFFRIRPSKKPDPKFDKENWASFQPYYFLIKLTFYFFYGHKSQYIWYFESLILQQKFNFRGILNLDVQTGSGSDQIFITGSGLILLISLEGPTFLYLCATCSVLSSDIVPWISKSFLIAVTEWKLELWRRGHRCHRVLQRRLYCMLYFFSSEISVLKSI